MLAASLLGGAAEAHAAPLPRLVVVRSAEAADCPDAVSLAAAVEQQMQRPALDPIGEDPASAVYEVHIARAQDGYAATLATGNQTRELSDPGSTCAELAEALALTLAIMLDSDPAASQPPPTPQPQPTPHPLPLPPPTPQPPPSPSSLTPHTPPPSRAWNAAIALGVGETFGFFTPWSFSVHGEVWLHHARFSVGAGIFAIPSARIEDTANASVHLALLTGALHGCGRLWKAPSGFRLSLCADALAGAAYGEGEGYAQNRSAAAPWASLGSMGLLEGPLVKRLGFSLRLGLAVPLIRQRFTVTRVADAESEATQETLLDPSPIGFFMGAGLHWSIL